MRTWKVLTVITVAAWHYETNSHGWTDERTAEAIGVQSSGVLIRSVLTDPEVPDPDLRENHVRTAEAVLTWFQGLTKASPFEARVMHALKECSAVGVHEYMIGLVATAVQVYKDGVKKHKVKDEWAKIVPGVLTECRDTVARVSWVGSRTDTQKEGTLEFSSWQPVRFITEDGHAIKTTLRDGRVGTLKQDDIIWISEAKGLKADSYRNTLMTRAGHVSYEKIG